MLTAVFSRSLELAIGLSCACLPSANLLFEKTVHSVSFPSFRGGNSDRDAQTVSEGARKASNATASSHWSSIVSKITVRTVNLTARGSYDPHTSRRNQTHYDYDVEYGARRSPVVVMFNNPLDVPSIRSTSEERSRTSLDRDFSEMATEDGPMEECSTSPGSGSRDALSRGGRTSLDLEDVDAIT